MTDLRVSISLFDSYMSAKQSKWIVKNVKLNLEARRIWPYVDDTYKRLIGVTALHAAISTNLDAFRPSTSPLSR